MAPVTRRSLLQGFGRPGGRRRLAQPYVANAQAKTITMWFAQGFVEDEDVALRKAVADYEKASGNKIELSIIPFAPMRQKIVSAMTSGVVPDVTHDQPERDPAALCLAGQVDRRRGRRRDAEGEIQ